MECLEKIILWIREVRARTGVNNESVGVGKLFVFSKTIYIKE
jgi:hypothetical protein